MRVVALIACWWLVGCGSNASDDDGELGGHCYPNATCNVGLSCAAGVCIVADAAVDAAIDAPHDSAIILADAVVDAPLVCPFEPYEQNNSISAAYVTAVDGTALTQTFSAILCPAGDKDYYAVAISIANRNLEVVVDRAPSDPAVQASILNSAGVPIANASLVTGDTIRAYTANLPTGTYYVEVFSGTTMSAHTYSLMINVTGP